MLFRFSLLLLFRDLAHVNADERGREDLVHVNADEPDRESRILNGKEVTDPYKYGYIANIGTCGATLIAPNVLLSAARCGDPTSITMNKLKVDSGGRQARESFRVIDVEDHPLFDKWQGFYSEMDYKLIRINGFSSNTPVLLGDGSYESEGTELTVMGWGITESGSHSDYLMEVDVEVSNFAKCKASYPKNLNGMSGMQIDDEYHVCAEELSCIGDDGGPLVKYNPNGQDTQVGVVSFFKGCGNPDYPAVYQKVSYAKRWIEEWLADWDCTPPGGRRRRRLKTGKKTKATKPPKPTGKKTKKPTGGKPVGKPTGSPTVSPTQCPRQCPDPEIGNEWIQVKILENFTPCGFVLDNDELRTAVALYKIDPVSTLFRYGEVAHWSVKDVTDFNKVFMDYENFNDDISGWDTSSATNMGLMFQGAKTFNQPIGMWNTAKVTAMNAMFENAHKFNQDVSMWDVSKVEASAGMFLSSTKFNQDMCPWVNSQPFMNDKDVNMIKLSGCDNLSVISDASFCHDCTKCSYDTDCPVRPCETGTCGSAGVCHYTLSRQNRLKIELAPGGVPGDAGYELTQDGKTVMFVNKLSGTNVYDWNVDVCAGVHQMCLTDANKSGSHKLDVTYFYSEKSVDDTSFPLTTVKNESTEKCVTFTVISW